MNITAAICSAIWWAASALVLIWPINSAAAANTPYSSSEEPEIGRPSASSRRISGQSGRSRSCSTAYLRNGRQVAEITAAAMHIAIATSVVARPAPKMPSCGRPNAPWISA